MIFEVYHPIDGSLNMVEDRGVEYTLITTVDCKSLEDVYFLTQNDLNSSYAELGKRSTSVGDLIYDVENNITYCIKGIGYDAFPGVGPESYTNDIEPQEFTYE